MLNWDLVANPLVWPLVMLLAAGTVAYVAARRVVPLCRALSVLGAGLTLVSGAVILGTAPPVRALWADLGGGLVLSLELAQSRLGMTVFIASGVFALLIAVYSLRALRGAADEGRFHAFLLWALAGACTVALAGNLLVLLVGWEIVTLMLFLMMNQGKDDAPAGAAKTYAVLGFADACLLLAIALLAAQPGGSANLSLTRGPVAVDSYGPVGYVIYLLILTAALAKAGAIPLHTWIPTAAADAPTPVMAYLPAALDKLLGIYLVALLSLRLLRPDASLQAVMMVVGGVTILAAVLMAMMQHNLKKLLAFHAVSQVGYMVLGIGTGTVAGIAGGLFHMLNHALYKCDLFLMSGTVGRACGSDRIEDMGGLARYLPVTFASSLIAAGAISGIPPLNGFASKWMVYQGTLGVANKPLASAMLLTAVFGSALTLASFVKVIHSAFLSRRPALDWPSGQAPRESGLLAGPMVVLALACIVLGLAPQWMVDTVFIPAATGGAAPGASMESLSGALWSPSQATVLILLGLGGGLLLVWLARRNFRSRVVRPFLCGELAAQGDDRFRVDGTHFYRTIEDLPAVGGLLHQGQGGAMDLYRWTGRYGHTLVELLRRQHTGLLCLYVAWCILGVAVTLAYLLLSAGV